LQDETISKSFSGRDGRGLYVCCGFSAMDGSTEPTCSLVHSAVNLKHGNKEDRNLMSVQNCSFVLHSLTYHRTGIHTVQDVYCMGCNDRLGWYYLKASEPAQKYKEGKPSCSESITAAHPIIRQVSPRAREAREGQRLEVGFLTSHVRRGRDCSIV
jgi:hypothetical protein